ncbi:hypothetical protein SEA_KUDEFRE_110 [Gordonia phage Kudefre]|uniref:Uncharacterized protein n=1 Tax=Gordonia phage Kudefre TaxID=2885975 RepID=A0AAE8Y7H3_9CAUD|nr:hypothetical protein L3Y24_gp133 [Gordonia phage Kudefre]UDL15328.1 hypothetical protein SEA_KUDEFRE_110 [Gordonia phage Kudefre]
MSNNIAAKKTVTEEVRIDTNNFLLTLDEVEAFVNEAKSRDFPGDSTVHMSCFGGQYMSVQRGRVSSF